MVCYYEKVQPIEHEGTCNGYNYNKPLSLGVGRAIPVLGIYKTNFVGVSTIFSGSLDNELWQAPKKVNCHMHEQLINQPSAGTYTVCLSVCPVTALEDVRL